MVVIRVDDLIDNLGKAWFISTLDVIKASPLLNLTKKGQPEWVKWTAEVDAVFWHLKYCLKREPVLWYLDFDGPFIQQKDASERGLSEAGPLKSTVRGSAGGLNLPGSLG
ncbi:hypothetical protein SRHO_G00146000 [Serrasalmus rhombeus]